MLKNTIFNNRAKHIEIKTTTTAVIKNELKYFPMAEVNNCTVYRAKPRGVTLDMIQ